MKRGTHHQGGRGHQSGGIQDRNSLFQDMMYNWQGAEDQGILNIQPPHMLNLSTSNRGAKSKVKSKPKEQRQLNQSDNMHDCHIPFPFPKPLNSQIPSSNCESLNPSNFVAPFQTTRRNSSAHLEVQNHLIFNNTNQNNPSNMTPNKMAYGRKNAKNNS